MRALCIYVFVMGPHQIGKSMIIIIRNPADIMYLYMYICVHKYVCAYVRIYKHVYVYMYVYKNQMPNHQIISILTTMQNKCLVNALHYKQH